MMSAIRARSAFSPPMSTLLLRSSAMTVLCCAVGSACFAAWPRPVRMRTTSVAEAFSSLMTSISRSPLWSICAIRRSMRATFDARSEIIRELLPVYAAKCPDWLISGRRIATSCEAETFCTV